MTEVCTRHEYLEDFRIWKKRENKCWGEKVGGEDRRKVVPG